MIHYIDWNCRLLAGMYEGGSSPQETIEGLSVLKERGITRFYMMPSYLPSYEPISRFLLRRDLAIERLRPILPEGVKIKSGACVCLEQNLHQTERLEKLFLKSGYLVLRLPYESYGDWIDLELNKLLYQRKCNRLIFSSFDLCLSCYPRPILEKLMRIDGAVFQFRYHSLTEPDVQAAIRHLLRENQTVLLGSELNDPGKAYYFEFRHYLNTAEQALGLDAFQTLLRGAERFWSK